LSGFVVFSIRNADDLPLHFRMLLSGDFQLILSERSTSLG
jgi:hypothetical protein